MGGSLGSKMGPISATVVSVISAVVAVIAAIYARQQARAAKRQADAAHGDVAPTFHTQNHEDNGRPPWGFRLTARNFNRRPLRVEAVRIGAPDGLLVWDDANEDPDSVRAIISAALRTGEAIIEIGKILEGVAPNAAAPTSYEHDFYVGLKTGTPDHRRTVQITVAVDWEYASGKAAAQIERLIVNLPIGIARQ